jgi:hypothetical protein
VLSFAEKPKGARGTVGAPALGCYIDRVWLLCCCKLLQIDENRRVLSFAEKPKGDALKAMMVDTTVLGLSKEEAAQKPFIASMGIYVFKKGVLGELTQHL